MPEEPVVPIVPPAVPAPARTPVSARADADPATPAPAAGQSAAAPPAPAPFCDDDGQPVDTAALSDPLAGPPDGDEAWLADVAAEVAAGYLDARQAQARPAAAAREALAAGFTHRDAEPAARGFAAGGPLDTMEPGPVLAGFADDAVCDGLAVLSDDELVGVLCAARRLASWAASVELTAVAGLDSRRAAWAAAAGDRRQAEHVGDEVAAALTLTCRAADRLVSLAAGVTRLPAAAAALAAGRIDLPRAVVFTDELANLGDVAAAAVAALAAPDAPGLTTSRLREVLRGAVLALDPDAARKRREKAQKNARVECGTEPSGTFSLAGRDQPPAETLAADQHVDAAARHLKAAGVEGTLEQLRARVFLTLLTGQPLYTLLPGQDQPGQDGPGEDGQGQPGQDAPSRDQPGRDQPGQDAPGEDGQGQPGGSSQDEDAGAGPKDDGDGGGEGLADGPGGGTRRPGPGRGPHGGPGFPGGQAFPAGLTGSVNLTVPLATWLGLTGQPGEAAGHGPLDAGASRGLAAALAAQQGSRWHLTITGPDGRAIGHGCARAGPGPPGARGAGNPEDLPWLAGITIKWLETGACGHARETLAYQPSRALRHLIKTRDRTCSYPGCRRAARRCDDDHTVPFDQGGRTCECNLAALCRRHHAAKQAPGWRLRQSQPGTLVWTLPSGRTHTVTPRLYPA